MADDLAHELNHMEGRKAVPAHVAPSFVWKSLSGPISTLLEGWCHHWFRQGHIPEEWRSGWIVFLTKPTKAPNKPNALRPIALQTPLAKSIMSLFVTAARAHALPMLCMFPQFAYLPGRGTWDAICRVYSHVREVASMTERWRYNASRSELNAEGPRPMLYGGCQLFLDLTQAFDHMPRSSLMQAFDLLQIPSHVANVLLQWHVDTKYILTYKGQTCTVPTYKGVRQGCRGAPFFWASFVALILNEVANTTSVEWMNTFCTFYADDGHLCFKFTSLAEFQQGLQYMGTVLDTLTQFGMTVNLTKSAILLELRGKHKKKAQQLYLRRRSHQQVLQIAGLHQTYDIPLKTSQDYLGVKISYAQTPLLTMRHRLTACNLRFKQMLPWFKRGNRISMLQKHELWYTCLFPVSSYGIDAIGVTEGTLNMLHKQLLRQLRQLGGDHSYLTHNSHRAFLSAHGLEHPIRALHCRLISQLERWEERRNTLPQHDILHSINATHLSQSVEITHQWLQDFMAQPEEDIHYHLAEAGMECNICGKQFQQQHTYRRHLVHEHGIAVLQGPELNIARDTIDGRPTCRHCGVAFISWQNMRYHIQSSSCPGMNCTKAPPLILQQHRRRLLDIYDAGDLQLLKEDGNLCTFLTHRCVLCGYWAARTQQMSAHVGRDHPDASALINKVMPNVTRARVQSPCEYCKKDFKSKTHTCAVMKQLGLALGDRRFRHEHPEAPDPPTMADHRSQAQYQCTSCDCQFATAAGLHQHLSMQHPHTTVQTTFQPLRDQVPGELKCSHCDRSFSTLKALKLHIIGNQCDTFIQDTAEVPYLWHHPVILAGLSGGTFDHLMGYKSLVRRLGLRCGICGHLSQSSTSLLRHLGTEHGDRWAELTKYAEWLQTHTALARLGCTCTRPPGGQHVCTLFSHLALFAHHDLHKFRHSDPDTKLTQALKLDLTVLCPSLHLLWPELDDWLVTGELAKLISTPDLCAALGQCCALCGRSVGAHDMFLHLRHQHPTDCTRGALYYRYLLDMTPHLHQCSVCNLHLTAAHECPILLQLAGLLCRLHHGHRGPGSGPKSNPADVGRPQDLGFHQGRTRRLPAPIQETESRTPAYQRQGKRQKSPDTTAEQPNRRSQANRPDPCSTITSTRRRVERFSHGAGLHAFFEPRSREHHVQDDASHGGMASHRAPGPHDALEDQGPESHAGGVADESPQTSDRSTRRRLGPDFAQVSLLDSGGEQQRTPLLLPAVEPDTKSSGNRHEQNSIDDAVRGQPDHQDIDLATATGTDHQVRGPSPQCPDSAEHEQGANIDSSGDPMEAITCSLSQTLHGDALRMAGDDTLRRLAADLGKDEAGQLTANSTSLSLGEATRDHVITEDGKYLRGLSNPQNCCYMNATVQGLLWGAIQQGPLQDSQWEILPEVFGQLLTDAPAEPMLLWSNGPWLTLLQSWDKPFEQHDLVDFAHFLLSQVSPCFASNLWEARVDADAQVRTVDGGSHHCPVRLYLSDGSKRDETALQDLITTWSLESYGLQALSGVSDMLCLQIDRFDQSGNKCFRKLVWSSPVFLPYFTGATMEVDKVPFEVTAVSFHLGDDSSSGHYRTALWDGEVWYLLDDDAPPAATPVLPDKILRNCCLLWLNSKNGGAMEIDVELPTEAAGSPTPLSRDQMMMNLKHAFSAGRPWQATWLSSIDRLDVGFLLEWPDVCRYLVFNCALCSLRPPNLLNHLKLHHAAWFAAAVPLTEDLMRGFLTKALPGRICACHPYYARTEQQDEHVCPCLLNFGLLHCFLRATQVANAQNTLALQLERSFS